MATRERQHEEAIELQESSASVVPLEIEVEAIDYPSGAKLITITIGLALSIFLAALDSTILSTAIPSITDQFGSIANIAWYGSAYSVSKTAFQSSWGKVSSTNSS